MEAKAKRAMDLFPSCMRRVGQRGGDESGVDFYREGPGMKEEEMGQHKEGERRGLACWLAVWRWHDKIL